MAKYHEKNIKNNKSPSFLQYFEAQALSKHCGFSLESFDESGCGLKCR